LCFNVVFFITEKMSSNYQRSKRQERKKGNLSFKEVAKFASRPGVGPEVNLGPLEQTTTELGSSQGFSFEEMIHFSSPEKHIVEREEHHPPKEGLSFSELKENFNRPTILPDLGMGPGVEMSFGRVEFTPNESLLSVAEMEQFASSDLMGPLAFGHEWEKPKEQSREMANSRFMKPEFSSFDHFGGEETHEKLTVEMLFEPFWIPTDDDFVVEEKWKHLKEKKIWKAVRPAWKPEISDLLLEEKSESRSMEKESQPRSMKKKKSKSRSMEKESKRQPMKKESKS